MPEAAGRPRGKTAMAAEVVTSALSDGLDERDAGPSAGGAREQEFERVQTSDFLDVTPVGDRKVIASQLGRSVGMIKRQQLQGSVGSLEVHGSIDGRDTSEGLQQAKGERWHRFDPGDEMFTTHGGGPRPGPQIAGSSPTRVSNSSLFPRPFDSTGRRGH